MTGVAVTVEAQSVTLALAGLARRLTDMSHPMALIGAALVNAKDLGFRSESDPWGKPWQELADSTIARRRKRSNRILRDTGHLQDSISAQSDATSVTLGLGVGTPQLGTVAKYAAAHQFGADVQHKARSGSVYFRQKKDGSIGTKFVKKSKSNFAQDVTIGAHTTHIPPRPFLPLDPSGNADIPPAVLANILGILKAHLDVQA